MTSPWTEDEDRVIRWAVRRGIPRKVVARPLGRSAEAIRKREQRLGIMPPAAPLAGHTSIRCRASFTWSAGLSVGGAA